jgi:hypothetical protein
MVYSIAKIDGHSIAASGRCRARHAAALELLRQRRRRRLTSAARAAELGATLLAEPSDVFEAGAAASLIPRARCSRSGRRRTTSARLVNALAR